MAAGCVYFGRGFVSSTVLVEAIRDLHDEPDHPLGDAIETFIRREDAERFIEEVRGDDPKLASYLRIEERETRGGRAELLVTGPDCYNGPARTMREMVS